MSKKNNKGTHRRAHAESMRKVGPPHPARADPGLTTLRFLRLSALVKSIMFGR